MSIPTSYPPINYSCYYAQSREGENFVQVHSLGIVLSGSMEFDDGAQKTTFQKGDLYSACKDHLIKFAKNPGLGGEFKSLSVLFPEDVLREFALEHNYRVEKKVEAQAFTRIPRDPALVAFMQSLRAYENLLHPSVLDPGTAELIRLKQKEALLLLLKLDPTLQQILFDFNPPERLDLETFMQKNFHFNVRLERFAYLTGRSLSTFKRDFEKIFHATPSRWLLQRRLQEAYTLISTKGMNPSDIYLDLGFEDLSHFSYTFKKEFGAAPTKISPNS